MVPSPVGPVFALELRGAATNVENGAAFKGAVVRYFATISSIFLLVNIDQSVWLAVTWS